MRRIINMELLFILLLSLASTLAFAVSDKSFTELIKNPNKETDIIVNFLKKLGVDTSNVNYTILENISLGEIQQAHQACKDLLAGPRIEDEMKVALTKLDDDLTFYPDLKQIADLKSRGLF